MGNADASTRKAPPLKGPPVLKSVLVQAPVAGSANVANVEIPLV